MKKKTLGVAVSEVLYERVRKVAFMRRLSISKWIKQLIQQELTKAKP